MTAGRRPGAGLPWLLLAPALGVLVPLFVVPMAALLRNSLNRDDPTALMIPDLTVQNYARILTDGQFAGAFGNSVVMALAVCLVTLATGYPFAYFLVWRARRTSALLQWIVYTPLIVSVIARVFGWIVITADSGLINTGLLALGVVREPVRLLYSAGGVFLGLAHRYLPLMILPLAHALSKVDASLLQASSGLGASPAYTFRHVVLPLSLPGVAAGCQLVFAAVLSDFVMPLLLGSTRFRMLAPAIFDEAIANVSWASAAAMALVMLAVTGLVIATVASALRRLAPWARSL